MLDSLAQRRLFLVNFMKMHEGKSICQINRSIPSTRVCVNLLRQRNHIWSKSNNGNNHLVKLMVILCHYQRPISFLHRPNRRFKWGYNRIITPATFKSLMVELISDYPSKCSIDSGLLFFLIEAVIIAPTWIFPS